MGDSSLVADNCRRCLGLLSRHSCLAMSPFCRWGVDGRVDAPVKPLTY